MKALLKIMMLFLGGLAFYSVSVASSEKQAITIEVNKTVITLNHSSLLSATLASADEITNGYGIKVRLNEETARMLRDITHQNIGQRINIKLNGKLISSPTIQSELGTEFIIIGFTQKEAKKFVESI